MSTGFELLEKYKLFKQVLSGFAVQEIQSKPIKRKQVWLQLKFINISTCLKTSLRSSKRKNNNTGCLSGNLLKTGVCVYRLQRQVSLPSNHFVCSTFRLHQRHSPSNTNVSAFTKCYYSAKLKPNFEQRNTTRFHFWRQFVTKGSESETHNSPFQDVLGDLNRWRGVPLNRARVGLFPSLCDDHLDRSAAI